MSERGYHIGQMNHAVLRHDEDDPRVAEFIDNLDRINGLAERSTGCLWRMDNDQMMAEDNSEAQAFLTARRNTVTVSLWETVADLKWFVYQTLHARFLNRRDEWFVPQGRPVFVLWKVPVGERPTLAEAKLRLDHLNAFGPSERAFDFDSYTKFCPEAEAA